MTYLTENRNKHYHLNHFNIQQLTFLCKELACSSAGYKNQVYQLLASVLPDVEKSTIIQCLEKAIQTEENQALGLDKEDCEGKEKCFVHSCFKS